MKITRVSSDGTAMEIEGAPLSEIGLDGAIIVDAKGRDVGPLLGFVCLEGKTISESLEESLPAGCTLRLPRVN